MGLTCAPVPTTAAPVPTTIAPVPTTVAPAPTTAVPMPTTAAPAPTAPFPPRLIESSTKLPGPGVCTCGKARYDVASCDSDECYKACDLRNTGHGVCITKKSASEMVVEPSNKNVTPSDNAPANVLTESNLILPVMVTMVSTLAMVGIVWGVSRLCKKNKKNSLLDELEKLDDPENSFSVLPDIQYQNN